MKPHLLYIGGDDHSLRIPFMLALRDHGYRITAAATADPAPFEQAGLDYHEFKCYRFMNPLGDVNALKMFSNLIAEVKPDLVQSFNTKPNLLVPMAARGFKDLVVVRTINGLAWIYSSDSPLALTMRPIYRAAHRLAAKFTTATIFQNQIDKSFFEANGMTGKSPSLLIRGSGVDVDRLKSDQKNGPSREQIRQELGLGDAEVVITVTRMTRHKGIPALLEAAALVHEKRPGVRFLLVGPRDSEGPLAVKQADFDRHAPYVNAIGPRPDVPALLAAADMFAFPTEYREGIPRVLLEAGVSGLPIVTTDMPGCTDVVRDGWNGFLVPPRTPHIMAEKIIQMLDDRERAREMGERSAKFVPQEFGLGLTVSRYADLYSELLDGQQRKSNSESKGNNSINIEQMSHGADAQPGTIEAAGADSA